MARLRAYILGGFGIYHLGHYTNTADLIAVVLEIKEEILAKEKVAPTTRRYAAVALDIVIADLVRLMSL